MGRRRICPSAAAPSAVSGSPFCLGFHGALLLAYPRACGRLFRCRLGDPGSAETGFARKVLLGDLAGSFQYTPACLSAGFLDSFRPGEFGGPSVHPCTSFPAGSDSEPIHRFAGGNLAGRASGCQPLHRSTTTGKNRRGFHLSHRFGDAACSRFPLKAFALPRRYGVWPGDGVRVPRSSGTGS